MTAQSYTVIEVRPEWVMETEHLGSKPKFWYRRSSKEPEWLFKYPQANTGQHWAEKIAGEIANLLNIAHGRVELSRPRGLDEQPRSRFRAGAHVL